MSLYQLKQENIRLSYQVRYLKNKLRELSGEATDISETGIAKRVINDYFKVDINIKCRQADIIRARGMYYHYVKTTTILSLKAIASTLDTNQHHSTIIWALHQHEAFYNIEKKYRTDYDNIVSLIEMELKK